MQIPLKMTRILIKIKFLYKLIISFPDNILKNVTWKREGLSGIKDIVKVRMNHLGDIVSIGEY